MLVERSVVIRKPVADVFNYVHDHKNFLAWQKGVISSQEEKGPANTVGAQYSEVRKFIGQEMRTTLEIITVEKNKKWAAKVIKGPVPYTVTMTYAAVPEGTLLTEVVEGESKGFFKLAESMVTTSLQKSLEQTRNLATLRRRIWQGFAYPLVVAVLAFAVFWLFVWFAGGAFENIFHDFGAKLPAATVLLFVARQASPWLIPTLVLGMILLVLAWRMGLNPSRRRSWLAAMPVLGPLWHWLGLLEWLGLLRALVQNQVSLFEALRLAGEGISDAHVAQLSRTLADGVARGRSLSEAMATQRAMPRSLVPLVRWGEQIGALPESLEVSSELLEERVRLRTLWLRMALPPLVFIGVGGALLWMFAVLMLPFMSLISSLTGGH